MAKADWGEGSYERTAATLEEAAVVAVSAAAITRGARVLDLGCGTGNAALEAARRGADVLAIDPSARLVDVCRARADAERLTVRAAVGDASEIPAADGTFDAVVSVFAVIFAPDAERAADEMLRVTKPGGRLVITTWSPRGPISRAGLVLRAAMIALDPAAAAREAPAWGDPGFVRALFAKRGASAAIEERSLVFTAPSPEAWFEEQETHHPIWRLVKRAFTDRPADYARIRQDSLTALEEGNEDPTRFRTTSTYLLVSVTR